MKIFFEISYRLSRGELQNYIKARPALTRENATTEWLELRYKTWINENITPKLSDFDFVTNPNDDSVSFTVEFKKKADGESFLRQMGGRVL